MSDKAPKCTVLMLAMVSTELSDETEFNRWYLDEHIPERLDCPGFLGARRFRLLEGSTPTYLTLYELEDASALETEQYRGLASNGSERTKLMTAAINQRVRAVYEVLSDDLG